MPTNTPESVRMLRNKQKLPNLPAGTARCAVDEPDVFRNHARVLNVPRDTKSAENNLKRPINTPETIRMSQNHQTYLLRAKYHAQMR